ncbi:unnamed protein product [Camellia sinensis]
MKLSDKDIVEMVFFPVVSKACRVLAEGIAVKASDLDIAAVMGMGFFPPYRGGIMLWADSLGSKYICSKLEEWSNVYDGGFFKPCAYLVERATKGALLYSCGASKISAIKFIFCPWGTIFVVTLCRLWKATNSVVFSQKAIPTQELVRQIQHEAAEIHYAFHSDHFTVKLNTDGCSKGNPGPAGYGGLCRDARGTWIFGFHGHLESATSEEAELWGIYRGLTIILEKSMRDVLFEADVEQVVIHINSATPSNYPYRALLEDIKFLMHRCNCEVRHILREGNQCADRLANIGVSLGDNLVVLDNPPPEIANLLVADIVGLSCDRA